MCDCFDGRPEIYEAHASKARKQHQCCECSGVIQAGDVYELAKGLWDGQWSRYKTCRRCVKARELLVAEFDCCVAHRGLHEEVSYSDLVRTVTDAMGRTVYKAQACSVQHGRMFPKFYEVAA